MEDTRNIPLMEAKASYRGRHCMHPGEAESNYHIQKSTLVSWQSTLFKKHCLARHSFFFPRLYFPSPCSPIKFRAIEGSAALSPCHLAQSRQYLPPPSHADKALHCQISPASPKESLYDWHVWLNWILGWILMSSNKKSIPPGCGTGFDGNKFH